MKPLVAVALVMLGCGNTRVEAPLMQARRVITVNASSAALPLVLEAANQYMRATPGVMVVPSVGADSAALRDLAARELSLVVTNLPVNDPGGVLAVRDVADVSIALFANRGAFDDKVQSLSRAQLRGIFTGKINSWVALGGGDERIVVIERRDAGEHAALAAFLGLPDFSAALSEEANALTMQSQLVARAGALSYLALPYRHQELALLALDGVAPTVEGARTQRYPFTIRERMVLRRDAPPEVQEFADFLLSPTVQSDLLDQLGYAAVVR